MADLNLGGTVNPVQTLSGSVYAVPGGTGGASAASDVSYDNSESGIEATNVQDAIDELSDEIASIPSGKDGADGQDGITPSIGDNGNWYLGDTDTGKPSRGEPGPSGADGKDGADGAPGAAGADGYTPVKGTDYWTPEDQQAIVDDVLAALPIWEGGSY